MTAEQTNETYVRRVTLVEDLLCNGVKLAAVTVHYLPDHPAVSDVETRGAEDDCEPEA